MESVENPVRELIIRKVAVWVKIDGDLNLFQKAHLSEKEYIIKDQLAVKKVGKSSGRYREKGKYESTFLTILHVLKLLDNFKLPNLKSNPFMLNFNFQRLTISILFSATSLMSCIITTSQVSETQLPIYEKAYNIILNNKELMEGAVISQKPRVSKEIISFGNYGQFFEEELLNSFSFSVQEMLFDSLVVSVDHKLKKIGSNRSTKKILFFSEVKRGFFFAEFFSDFPNNRFRFERRPDFGESRVFLFEGSGKDILLIGSKTLAYN